MKILQQSVKVKRGSRVVINFSQPSSIYLMTEVNFKRYKDGSSFRRLGGEYNKSPVEFVAPYDGTWHAVIEKGSHFSPTSVTGSVEILPPLRKETAYFDEEEEWKSDHPDAIVAETTEEEEKNEVLDEIESDVDDSNESNDEQEDNDDDEKD